MKKIFEVYLMKLILISTLVIVLLSPVIADGRDITVGKGGDYSKIQDAIDDASDGDIIWVMSGTYRENVEVNKAISLEGWNTDNGDPIVDAGNRGSAITLSADGITLEGFRVRNSNEAGVDVKSSFNKIVDIRASGNRYGIFLDSSSGNFIRSSNVGSTEVSDNYYGVYLTSSDSNSIQRIEASDNNYGIYLESSTGNDISGNNLDDNYNDAYDDSIGENGNLWGGSGGNHYSNYDNPEEGCENPTESGECESPYVIPGGSSQDNYPKISADKIEYPNRDGREKTSPPKKKKNN